MTTSDNKTKHLHRCMRCGIDFECRNEGSCKAGFNVVPNIYENGVLIEHCPLTPDWNWIREYAKRYREQVETYLDPQGMRCGAEIPVSNGEVWHCRKEYLHTGVHSHHNDCGAVGGPNETFCGMPNNHAGPHAWEKRERSI